MEHWYQAGFCIFQFQFQIQSKKKNNNIHLRNLQLINLNVNHIVLSKQWEISYTIKRTNKITTLTVTLGSEYLRTFPIIVLRTKHLINFDFFSLFSFFNYIF